MKGMYDMKQFETKHYIFNFHEDSKAEHDIHEIAFCQEKSAWRNCLLEKKLRSQ